MLNSLEELIEESLREVQRAEKYMNLLLFSYITLIKRKLEIYDNFIDQIHGRMLGKVIGLVPKKNVSLSHMDNYFSKNALVLLSRTLYLLL